MLILKENVNYKACFVGEKSNLIQIDLLKDVIPMILYFIEEMKLVYRILTSNFR